MSLDITNPGQASNVRARFEQAPYPAEPVSSRVFRRPSEVYRASIATPFLLRDGALPKAGARILDAGCGTGGKSVRLAAANPDCQVLGVDFSAQAIDVACARAAAASVSNVEFRHAALEDLTDEEGSFDFVQCDDVLYLVDSPESVLRTLAGLLGPAGILRANVHNARVRQRHLRAQRALELLGVLELPAEKALAATRSVYASLRSRTRLRQETSAGLRSLEYVLSNQALVGDRAFTLDQTLGLIDGAGLVHFAWVDHRRWSIRRLFRRRARDGPEYRRLASLSRFDRYRFVDAVDYYQRLYDFWCCHPAALSAPDDEPTFPGVGADRRYRLHPALAQSGLLRAVERAREAGGAFDLGAFVPLHESRRPVPAQTQDLLLTIGRGEWTDPELRRAWSRLRPVRPQDGKPSPPADVERELRLGLEFLCDCGVVLALGGSGSRSGA